MKFIDFILGRNSETNPDYLVGTKSGKTVKVPITYKKYVALISQSGTNAPAVNILENTIGSIVWSRNSVGNYYATLNGAFPNINKIAIFYGASRSDGVDRYADYFDANTLELFTAISGSNSDDLLDQDPIEIRVYQ